MKQVIRIKNLKKYYYLFDKDFKRLIWLMTNKGFSSIKKAIDDISFTVNEGEVVGFIGRNGAGKSTLMKLIASITFPTYGDIKVDGKVGSLINLSAGFNNKYTGRENIYYKSKLMGLSKDYVDNIIDEIIEFADIGEYFDITFSTYSSGMRARLGFALAVFTNPDILIVDEVFAVGDKDFKRKSAKKTREMFQSGKTIIFSSHSEQQIRQFCTRVVYLNDGKIVFDGDVEKALKMYNENS